MATVLYDSSPLPGAIAWYLVNSPPFNGFVRKVQQGSGVIDVPTYVYEGYGDQLGADDLIVVTKETRMTTQALYLFTDQPLIGIGVPLFSRVAVPARYQVVSY